MQLSRLASILRKTIGGIGDDALLTRAAAIAFYSALSFAPLIVLLLWLLAALRPEWQQQLTDGLAGILGAKAAGAITLVLQNAKSRPTLGNVAGVVGLLITLFSASVVFAQLQGALNVIWDVQARPGKAITAWLWARARAIALLVGVTFLLIVSFVVSTLIRFFVPTDSWIWSVAEQVISLLVFIAAFGAMYRVLPDARIAWADAWRGALLTTVLFIAGKYAIDLYIRHASVGGAYGPAGALVVLLTWVYYASTIVLMGAELTHGLSAARGEKARPEQQAERSNDKEIRSG
ncbi:YihY/virulence factor BrkB family protein [Rhodanobacter sp. FDAARGOS 1247]|uniref:YihY/virulence factor BrkB family protein n=1 Tax=Rhodanobacter sp. FDAARGOS 1247 TaxID=2778082 RepID=UPI00194E37E7|nr:YihY/virulence factor BrkB family protein [Rhodanobacter sp. FDAARGOS 1247]QRP63266.1 YihY/virulence factor BrkB family protein [Rhodanobacter sp. FDAARGOS 1247]